MVSLYFRLLSVFFPLWMDVMIAFGTYAHFWHPRHSVRESHTSAMCWLKKYLPVFVWNLSSACFIWCLSSCVGRGGEQPSQFTFSMAFVTLEPTIDSILYSVVSFTDQYFQSFPLWHSFSTTEHPRYLSLYRIWLNLCSVKSFPNNSHHLILFLIALSTQVHSTFYLLINLILISIFHDCPLLPNGTCWYLSLCQFQLPGNLSSHK